MNKLQRSLRNVGGLGLPVGFLCLAASVMYMGGRMADGQKAAPVAPKVEPAPEPKPCPDGPWGPRGASVDAVAPDGTEPDVDYPSESWMANIGSRKDGAGMCVFTAFEMMCRHAGLESFRGFRDWCAENYRGGGHPEKLAALVTAYCKAKNLPPLKFFQYEGADLSVVQRVLATGRFSGVTLYHSKMYGGRIYHAVNCAHGTGPRYYAVCDNNKMRGHPSPPYEWFDGKEAFQHAISVNGRYWAYWLDRPGLPCPPKN